GHRVVAGPPIAPKGAVAEVFERFVADARRADQEVVVFSADTELIDALDAAGVPHRALCIGVQPEWAPAAYHTRGAERRTLRAQCNRARNKGITVRECEHDPEAIARLEETVQPLIDAWLDARRMAVMGFLVALTPFE